MDGMQRLCWLCLLLAAACGAQITGADDAPSAGDLPGAGAAGTGADMRAGRRWMPAAMPGQAGAGGAMSAGRGSAAPLAGRGGDEAKPSPAAAGGGAPAPEPVASAAAGSGGQASAAPQMDTRDDAKPSHDVMAGKVRYLGRVDDRDPEAVRFSWAGSGIAAVVKGSKVSVRLESLEDSIYYWPVIDGEPGERIEVDEGEHVVTLAEGLSDAEHKIELYRDTEADGPVSVFHGFEEGALVGAPPPSDRFFEIVGDSISVGFGSLETERHGDSPGPSCGADHSSSSWFLTYGARAARELNAEVSTLARSGYGMYRGYGQNENVMPPLFDDTLGDEEEPRWSFERKPAALIINLGTNDWNGGDPGSSYERAYIEFIEEVRQHYPDALILLTIGPTLEDGRKRQVEARLQRVMAAREEDGDDKIDMIDIGIQDTEVTGCGWHPSADEHMRVGKVLAEALATRLGW